MNENKGGELGALQEEIETREVGITHVDWYDTAVCQGEKIIEIKGSKIVAPLKLEMSVTLRTGMERTQFYGDIKKGDKLTITGFRNHGGSEIVQVSKGEVSNTDWVRPSHLEEGLTIPQDMGQRQRQRQ